MRLLSHVTKEQATQIIDAAALGEYQVLLGAGASHDSRDARDNQIPLAGGFSEFIKGEFGLVDQADLSLSYDRAVRRVGERQVYNKLRERFTSCNPAAWYENFVGITWRRIWTLNIDDVVERAYERYASSAAQSASKPINWDDPFSESASLQIVHLHGHLEGSNPRRLVFSIAEYLNAREEMHAWHRIFGDYWQNKPFMVLGGKLVSEYDLAKIFRTKVATSHTPSLYISKSIDRDTQLDLEGWGLIPIKSTVEDFINALKEEIDASGLASSSRLRLANLRNDTVAGFFSTFRYLDPDRVAEPPSGHDFLLGDPPMWKDIIDGHDAILTWEEQLNSQIDQEFVGSSPTQAVHVVLSKRLSGTSTGAYRLARMQQSSTRDVFLFRADLRPDLRATVDYLSQARQTLLIFDGVADFADDVQAIADRCADRGIQCVILAFENEARRNKVVAELNGDQVVLHDELQVDRLQIDDAKTLVRHVDNLSRNSMIADLSFSQQVKIFLSRGLFAGMARCEFGKGFKNRIAAEIEALDDQNLLRLFLIVSILDTLGYSLPLQFTTVAGVSADAVKKQLLHDRRANDLLAIKDGLIYSRHRQLGLEPALQRVGSKGARSVLYELAVDLRPYVNSRTIRARTLEYRILAGIMRANSLRGWIGLENLKSWYDDLEPKYKENARFWEQRAIAAQILENWGPAVSFAKEATRLAPETYRYNTLGSILLARVERDSSLSAEQRLETYQSGRSALSSARSLDPKNPVPIETFLNAVLGILRSSVIYAQDLPLVRDWQQWLKDARRHPAFRHTIETRRLDGMQESFLHTVFGNDESESMP